MCIAIYKPANKIIEKETLEICQENNPDGCGYAYIDENKHIQIRKAMQFEEFWEDYRKDSSEYLDSPFLIHFRIKSHGTIDLYNCHPFMIDDHTCFIHNGIISNVPTDKVKSDTQIFNELILSKLQPGWIHSEGIKLLIEEFIRYSKLVVMTDEGRVAIYNEKKGEWVDGIWYSNSTYKPRVTSYRNLGYNNTSYQYTKQYNFKTNSFETKKRNPIVFTKKCGICQTYHSPDALFYSKGGGYICFDCMEILDSFAEEIVKLKWFDVIDQQQQVEGGN